MKTNRLLLFILCMLALGMWSCNNDTDVVTPTDNTGISKKTATYESTFAINWLNVHLQLIKTTPGFVPPVAARSLNYAAIALYESVAPGMPGYQSLAGQLYGLTTLPKPDLSLDYNWALAASTSQYTILKEMFLTTSNKNQTAIDSVRKYYETQLKAGLSEAVIDRSIRYGAAVAAAVFEFSKTDGGSNGHLNNFPTNYTLPRGIGYWKPTGTQATPLLPKWGNNRTMAYDNMWLDGLSAPITFSFEQNSAFYKSAKDVFDKSKSLTADQKAIANFFADGSGTVTPPGHHFNVAKEILATQKTKLDKTAEIFVKIGMSLNDAFVSCWRAKYKYFLMRPSTYIKQTIDKTWVPLLANPPFPDYASGHSTAAGACVEILETEFGKTYKFQDNTHEGTWPSRSYESLEQYGQETSLSRVYGGIHYEFSCVNGYESGRQIAKNIKALKFKK
jgi:hypothetical protein